MTIRKEIRVSGIVQGVGFRPYVYRLATGRNLGGSISNTASGVTIEVQGPTDLVEDFVATLPEEAPELAQISLLTIREIPCKTDEPFEILSSQSGEPANTLISPDVAVCADCLRELFDPADRRYLYPFINCTNCGPRFTIVREIPYDRPRTSMSIFPMCNACREEYEDPANRRFHAQPNACWECGPKLELLDAEGHSIPLLDSLAGAVEILRSGSVLALKGLGGFHLAVDATNQAAVERLRERKRRIEKPFAVMVPDAETAARFCEMDSEGTRLLTSRQRPIVLLPKAERCAIAESVAPRQGDLGIFLPYTPLHYLLFAAGQFEALVMTSGNLSEEPIATGNREAVDRLRGIADAFLVHNREILTRCDDSVVRHAAGRTRPIRRSRGYVPCPVRLHKQVPPILAVGGELKNTLCFTRGENAFLSQHVGDLENVETYDFFQQTAAYLSKVLEIEPGIIACDLHPDYLSTKWALGQTGVRRVGVQHHHAHVAACMAENGIDGPVIGFALDGTGYGSDGQVWGGEALVSRYDGFQRVAHLAYVALPGGVASIREPWRMAVSYLFNTFGHEFLDLKIPFVERLHRGRANLVVRAITQQINSPLTSSCGRLFDAVAALVGIGPRANYEAQAAIELEMLARRSRDRGAYPLKVFREGECQQIDTRPLVEAVVGDLARGVPPETISLRFHNGLTETFAQLADSLRRETSIRRVCLSGGVFNNSILLATLMDKLQAGGFEVFTHWQVPAGDGGLSLGQAMVAAHSAPSS